LPSSISIQDLSFYYPGEASPALKDIFLEIECGSRFGIFGPNGAGKTTLMQLITGLLKYEQGSVKLWDKEMRTEGKVMRGQFGWVPQDFSFYPELSPLENLSFFGAWYGMEPAAIKSRSEELLEILGLSRVAKKQVHQFSGGMKRRINLAIGVLHKPRLLILDEPTVGVDVQTRNAIITYLKEINKEGTTLVYTSHHLKEAEELCEEIALIDQGEIIARDKLTHLLEQNKQEGLESLFLHLTGRDYRD